MIVAGVVNVVGSTAAVITGIAAAIVAIGVLARHRYVGRPLRWLWRRNVAEPVGSWGHKLISDVADTRVREVVTEVVDRRIDHLMTHRNGGSSLKDLADAVDRNEKGISHVREMMSRSLRHDDQRDREGFRYGSKPDDELED